MARNHPFTEEEYKEIYSKVPKLCVELVLQPKTGGVVLAKRVAQSWNGKWYLPGVSVHYRESMEDAVKRAALEELGIRVDVGEMLGFIEYWSEEQERGFGYSVTFQFAVSTPDEIPTMNQDGEEIHIFETIPENTLDEHVTFLKDNLEMS